MGEKALDVEREEEQGREEDAAGEEEGERKRATG